MNPTSSGALTETAFDAVFKDYVVFKDIPLENPDNYPETLLTKVDRLFFDHRKLQKMYGSPRELIDNLRIYNNFPSNHRKLKFDICEPFNTRVVKYQNLKGEDYICKQDIFILMQKMMEKHLKNEMLFTIQIIFFKHYESFLKDSCEFIKYDQKWIDSVEDALLFLWKNAKGVLDEPQDPDPPDYLELFDEFKKSSPNWEEKDYIPIRNVYEKAKSGEIQKLPNNSIRFLRYMGITMRTFFLKRRHYLAPFKVTKTGNANSVVRIFVDGADQFVMKREFFNSLNMRNPEKEPLKFDDDKKGFLSVISTSTDGEFNKYMDLIKDIQFIRFPIRRAQHAAVPIMTPYGGYCILAIDAFMEYFHFLIFSHRIFQKNDRGYLEMVEKEMDRAEKLFRENKNGIYFITIECLESFKKGTDRILQSLPPIPTIEFRSVDEFGFTLDDLKDELNHLKLTEIFPEALNYAEQVYEEIDEKKKEDVLRTCDLFEALKKCQMICVLKRYPILREFVHHQNSCHLFPPLNCLRCKRRSLGLQSSSDELATAISSNAVSSSDEKKKQKKEAKKEKEKKKFEGLRKGLEMKKKKKKKKKEENIEDKIVKFLEEVKKAEDVVRMSIEDFGDLEDSEKEEDLEFQGLDDPGDSEDLKNEEFIDSDLPKSIHNPEDLKNPDYIKISEETKKIDDFIVESPENRDYNPLEVTKISEDAKDSNNMSMESPERFQNSKGDDLKDLDDVKNLEISNMECQNDAKISEIIQKPADDCSKPEDNNNDDASDPKGLIIKSPADKKILDHIASESPDSPEKSEEMTAEPLEIAVNRDNNVTSLEEAEKSGDMIDKSPDDLRIQGGVAKGPGDVIKDSEAVKEAEEVKVSKDVIFLDEVKESEDSKESEDPDEVGNREEATKISESTVESGDEDFKTPDAVMISGNVKKPENRLTTSSANALKESEAPRNSDNLENAVTNAFYALKAPEDVKNPKDTKIKEASESNDLNKNPGGTLESRIVKSPISAPSNDIFDSKHLEMDSDTNQKSLNDSGISETSNEIQKAMDNYSDPGESPTNDAKLLENAPFKSPDGSKGSEDDQESDDVFISILVENQEESRNSESLEPPELAEAIQKSPEIIQDPNPPNSEDILKAAPCREWRTRGSQTDSDESRISEMIQGHEKEKEEMRERFEAAKSKMEEEIGELKKERPGVEEMEKQIKELKDQNLQLSIKNEEKERMIKMLLDRMTLSTSSTPSGF